MSTELVNNTLAAATANNSINQKAEYKIRKQRLDRLDTAIAELPKSFDSWLQHLSAYCTAGAGLASHLEVILEDSPLLMVALRYKEACEQISEKCDRQGTLLQPEFVAACKKVGPSVSSLRHCLDVHAKLSSKYETAQNHLENVTNADSKSKAKVEQAELKFQNSLKEFTNQDTQLAKATDELDNGRKSTLGSCFLSIIEAQSKLLASAAEIMSPLSVYKDLGKSLIDPQSSSFVKEVTLNWLASAQVHRNLRTFGTLSRNDIQCMTYTGSEGLPDTIRLGLNKKVDSLLKSYLKELEKCHKTSRTVSGGFHYNSKGTELALKDCCSELEALGAGAPHASSRQEKEEQIERDVPRSVFCVGEKLLGGSTGGNDSQDNIQEKSNAIEVLTASLPEAQKQSVSSAKIHEFAFHVLNESCTTVTHTASKTAVQLLYGKANLVLVRPSPQYDDQHPIEITISSDSSLLITAPSVWWIVEDYATLSSLSRLTAPDTYLATVDTVYRLELDLMEFINSSSTSPVPSISVICSHINSDYSSYTTSGRHKHRDRGGGTESKRSRHHHHHRQHQHSHASPDRDSHVSRHAPPLPLPSGRHASTDSEGLQEESNSSDSSTLAMNSPSLDGVSTGSSRSSSGGHGGHRSLIRSASNDSISTATSNITLKANPYEPEDLASILPTSYQPNVLNQNTLMAFSKSSETNKPSNPHRYSNRRNRGDVRRDERDQSEKLNDKSLDSSSYPAVGNNSKFTPATPAEFNNVFNYLGQQTGYDETYRHRSKMGVTQSEESSADERDFLSEEDESKCSELEHSQIIVGRGEADHVRPGPPHLVSNSTGSLDSGIAMHHTLRNGPSSIKRGDRLPSAAVAPGGGVAGMGGYGLNNDDTNWSMENIYNMRLGPYYPPSSDSDSDNPSGRNSRDTNFSHDDIPGRSSSSNSFHSVSLGQRTSIDSDSLSLPDHDRDYQMPPFNQAPGSHRGTHRRYPSLSSSSTYDPLSQDPYDLGLPRGGSGASFSQEIPMARSQDPPPLDREIHHHHGHFSNPYESHDMRPSGVGPSQYLSDPYPGGPPPFSHQRRMEFPPSPGPMHRPPPPPPHYYDGYGPPPPNHMMGPPPIRGPPPHDMFRPGPFRTTTPDISPAPSPHPTPPTTPPPHPVPPMMMQPSPIRMPRLPPHNMFRGPPPPRGGDFDFHHPSARGVPLHPPPPMGHRQPPPPHMPHPPPGRVMMSHRPPHPPAHLLEWAPEQQSHWRHH